MRTGEKHQGNISSYARTSIYWERQDSDSALCAVHAVNNLLQRPATNSADMHATAAQLDDEERALLHHREQSREEGNARPSGDFTIQVVQRVLGMQQEGWDLTDSRNPSVWERIAHEPHKEIGYLINPGGHWRALPGDATR